ncbi:type II and III secretion system protein family protein [Vibrio nigripulchritudo]|uniref:type II and III secretion system protein family protein n=1 Tax=Vibrio nigripulchritudo TaxID=28173 RepID=UPI00069742E7|nr:type II and III secretion system protein family protein [Vibrio nigripulchritudo]
MNYLIENILRGYSRIFIALFFSIFFASGSYAAKVESTKNNINLYVGEAKVLRLKNHAHTVFIADPEIASFQAPSATSLILFGRAPGSTSLFVLNKNGEQVYSTNINVGFDLSKLRPALKREFPNANIDIRPYGMGVMLTGTVPDADTAARALALTNELITQAIPTESRSEVSKNANSGDAVGSGTAGIKYGTVINHLKINSPTQVNIRIRIAEVSKTVQENFGFNWNYMYSGLKNVAEKVAFKPNSIVSNLSSSNGDVIGMIDILAQEDMISVLAEPNLTATSGETASFLAGGEVPQIVGGSATEAPTVEYKQFGVLLAVTPTILSGNRIGLKVKTEISDVSTTNSVSDGQFEQKGFDIRRAQTSVELASGQSFALAGLIRRKTEDELQNLPWLNEIPVLGRLFESSQFKNNETELVIIASAYLVEPTNAPMALPTDNVHLSSPLERLIFGRSLKPIEDYQKPPQAIADQVFQDFEF